MILCRRLRDWTCTRKVSQENLALSKFIFVEKIIDPTGLLTFPVHGGRAEPRHEQETLTKANYRISESGQAFTSINQSSITLARLFRGSGGGASGTVEDWWLAMFPRREKEQKTFFGVCVGGSSPHWARCNKLIDRIACAKCREWFGCGIKQAGKATNTKMFREKYLTFIYFYYSLLEGCTNGSGLMLYWKGQVLVSSNYVWCSNLQHLFSSFLHPHHLLHQHR